MLRWLGHRIHPICRQLGKPCLLQSFRAFGQSLFFHLFHALRQNARLIERHLQLEVELLRLFDLAAPLAQSTVHADGILFIRIVLLRVLIFAFFDSQRICRG